MHLIFSCTGYMIALSSGNHKLLSKGNINGIQISTTELIMTFRALTAYCEFCWLLLIHRWQILRSTLDNHSRFLPVLFLLAETLCCGWLDRSQQTCREKPGENWKSARAGCEITAPPHTQAEINLRERRCCNAFWRTQSLNGLILFPCTARRKTLFKIS